MTEPWKQKLDNSWLTSPEAIQEEEKATARFEVPWKRKLDNPYLPPQGNVPNVPKGFQGPSEPMFEKVFANLIQAESAGRHRKKDGSLLEGPYIPGQGTAKGLTQVMDATASKPGFGVAPIRNDSEDEYDRFGRDYLGAMLTQFGGDYPKALAAYNAGAGNVQKAITRAAKAGKDNDWMDFLPKKEETIPYVNKIMKGLQ